MNGGPASGATPRSSPSRSTWKLRGRAMRLVLNLRDSDPGVRAESASELSRKRTAFQDLGAILWFGDSVVASLLQGAVAYTRTLASGRVTEAAAEEMVHVLELLSTTAAHPVSRPEFIGAGMVTMLARPLLQHKEIFAGATFHQGVQNALFKVFICLCKGSAEDVSPFTELLRAGVLEASLVLLCESQALEGSRNTTCLDLTSSVLELVQLVIDSPQNMGIRRLALYRGVPEHFTSPRLLDDLLASLEKVFAGVDTVMPCVVAGALRCTASLLHAFPPSAPGQQVQRCFGVLGARAMVGKIFTSLPSLRSQRSGLMAVVGEWRDSSSHGGSLRSAFELVDAFATGHADPAPTRGPQLAAPDWSFVPGSHQGAPPLHVAVPGGHHGFAPALGTWPPEARPRPEWAFRPRSPTTHPGPAPAATQLPRPPDWAFGAWPLDPPQGCTEPPPAGAGFGYWHPAAAPPAAQGVRGCPAVLWSWAPAPSAGPRSGLPHTPSRGPCAGQSAATSEAEPQRDGEGPSAAPPDLPYSVSLFTSTHIWTPEPDALPSAPPPDSPHPAAPHKWSPEAGPSAPPPDPPHPAAPYKGSPEVDPSAAPADPSHSVAPYKGSPEPSARPSASPGLPHAGSLSSWIPKAGPSAAPSELMPHPASYDLPDSLFSWSSPEASPASPPYPPRAASILVGRPAPELDHAASLFTGPSAAPPELPCAAPLVSDPGAVTPDLPCVRSLFSWTPEPGPAAAAPEVPPRSLSAPGPSRKLQWSEVAAGPVSPPGPTAPSTSEAGSSWSDVAAGLGRPRPPAEAGGGDAAEEAEAKEEGRDVRKVLGELVIN